jgi:hypothetical protein
MKVRVVRKQCGILDLPVRYGMEVGLKRKASAKNMVLIQLSKSLIFFTSAT